MRWALEGKGRAGGRAGGRDRHELGVDGAGSCPIRASELLGRFIQRVLTAVIACATLITETHNNQL